jgi:predicted O-methyltransferase YrrM
LGISLERFIEVSKQLYERSLSLGIPAISYEDGLVLASLAFIYCAANSTMRAVDAGAGIGYSTIFLAYGMGQRCRGDSQQLRIGRRGLTSSCQTCSC